MILFLGTKQGKDQTKTLEGISCPYCHQLNTLTSISVPIYFHLFWISLFRVNTNQFVECSHCRKGYYENEFTKEMKQALEIN